MKARKGLGFTALGGAALIGLFSAPASATVLTFSILQDNQFPAGFKTLEVPGAGYDFTDYGDRVTATSAVSGSYTYHYAEGNGFTPNVELGFSHVPATFGQGQHHYNAEANWPDEVNYLHFEDNALFSIALTPDAGYGVNLESFIVELYLDGPPGGVDFNWVARKDHDAGDVLASGSLLDITTAADPMANVNASHTGTIVLQMSFTNAGTGGVVGMDDLSFTQFAIPEPASLTLLACGATLTLRRRRA